MINLRLSQQLLLLLIKSFDEEVPQGYLGRTAIQKLVYISRQIGIPFPYKFEIYFYGPYSERLSYDIEDFLLFDLIRDTSRDPSRYSKYELTELGNNLVQQIEKEIPDEIKEKLKLIAKAFGPLEPETLELITTVHFLASGLKAKGKEINEDDVINKVVGIKGKKFTREQISKVFDALREIGLV